MKIFISLKCIILILYLGGSLLTRVFAQKTNKNNTSEITKLLNDIDIKESLKETGAVILLKDSKLSIDEKCRTHFTVRIVGKLYNNEAKLNYNQIPIFYNSYYDEISLDYARTIKEDGTILEVSKDAIQIKTNSEYMSTRQYSDQRILTFSLPALSVGAGFEYQVTLSQKEPIIEGHWFGQHEFQLVLFNLKAPFIPRIDPICESRFTLKIPKEMNFLSQLHNVNITPEIDTVANYKLYRWIARELPSISINKGMPNLYDLTAEIKLTSLNNWSEIDKWASEKILSRIEVTPEIHTKAEALIKTAKTYEEKIEAIFDFVQKKIDYIQADLNRGGYTPHFANEVLRYQYGDCKDKTILFISLLKAVGIEAYPVLINPLPHSEASKKIPSPYFSHLIVYIPKTGKDLWLDATTNNVKFPGLHFANKNRWAFVLDQQGGKFIKTPPSIPEDNLGITNIKLFVKDGVGFGQIIIEGYGVFNDNLNLYMESFTREQKEDMFKEYVASLYPKCQVDTIILSEINGYQSSYKMISEFKTQEVYNDWLIIFKYESNGRIPIMYYYSDLTNLPSPEKLKYDYNFGYKFKLKNKELYLPPATEFHPSTIPEDDSLNTEMLSFKRNFFQEQDSVFVCWELSLKCSTIPQHEYNNFYNDVKNILDKLSWEVHFQKKSSFENYTDKMRISSILVATENQAKAILEKLEKGELFSDLAKEYSIGPAKEKGGDLGYFAPGDMAIDLDTIAVNLEVGEYSEIIQLNNKYFIIMKTEEKLASEFKSDNLFETLLIKGKTALKNGLFPLALETLTEASALRADHEELQLLIGNAYRHNDFYDKAIDSYCKVIEKDSSHESVYQELGLAYRAKEMYPEAITALKKSLELKGDEANTYLNLGMCYLESGKKEKADSCFQKAVKLDPVLYRYYNKLGYKLLREGFYSKSIAAYKESIALKPDFANSYGNMGWAYYLNGDYEKCIEFSEKAVELNTNSFYARYNIAIAYLRLLQIEKAKKDYIETKNLDLSINKGIHPGAISDLKELIKQNILVEEVRYILINIFGLNDDEIGI